MSVVNVSGLQAHSTENDFLPARPYCGNQDSYLSEGSEVKIKNAAFPP